MKSKLQLQIEERNKNVREGEVIVYSDQHNHNRYIAVSDQEVLTGDIQITPLNFDDTFDKHEELQIINIHNLQYGWQLERSN